MIYVVISDGLNRQSGLINKKGDCRVLRQPQSLLSTEVNEYIEKTANKITKSDRSSAYTTLFAALKLFFDAEGFDLKRTENGKPYLYSSLPCYDKSISVSLSHSDSIIAVALSDEGDVGVDIECGVEKEKAERLERRFLSDITPENDNIEIEYYYAGFKENEAVFEKIVPQCDTQVDFLSKWVFAESIIKCFGLTFSEISKINELAGKTKTHIVSINNFKIATTVAK